MTIILYVIDALRADHLSCYGYKRNTSPNIDEFAKQGILFENVFAQSNWTKPCAASLLTSTYPSVHGVHTYDDVLSSRFKTLAQYMSENDYITAGFSGIVTMSSQFGFNSGFQKFYDLWKSNTVAKKRSKEVTYLGGGSGKRVEFTIPLAEDINEKVLCWIKKHGDSDFFLLIWAMDPHDPYSAPAPVNTTYRDGYNGVIDGSAKSRSFVKNEEDRMHLINLYDGEISYFDQQFGLFIKRLKEMGLYDCTLLIITSDHGEVFRWDERRSVTKILSGHGGFPYDELIRIPLIMKIPALPGNKKVSELVQSIDIMPTILDFLNITTTHGVQGKSLLPLIRGEAKDLNARVYSERFPNSARDYSKRSPDWAMVRTKKKKCVTYQAPSKLKEAIVSKELLARYLLSWKETYLFDLEKEPHERNRFGVIEGRIFGLVKFSMLVPKGGVYSWTGFMKYLLPLIKGLFRTAKNSTISDLEHKITRWQESNKTLKELIVKGEHKEKAELDEEIKKRLQNLGYLD